MAANQSMARKYNMREIIDALLSEGEMSRAGLAKFLGLSKPATAENVEKLIKMGLVIETGQGITTGKGGRKPRMLCLNKLYRTVVSVDLSDTYPVIAIGNLAGEVLAKTKLDIATQSMDSGEKIRAMTTAVRRLMQSAGCPAAGLGVIIICAPGIFRGDNTPVNTGEQPEGWLDISLDYALTREFMAPVLVKNNISAAALGEYAISLCNEKCKNMVFLSCGTRLGAGIIIEGRLYEGSHLAAGEMSRLIGHGILENGNTVEDAVSIGALIRDIELDIIAGRAPETVSRFAGESGRLKFSHIIAASHRDNSYITEKMRGVGRNLGIIITNMAAVLDMEYVVVGGGYVEFFDVIKPEVEAMLAKYLTAPPCLAQSRLGDEASLRGSLIFGRDRLFDKLEL